MLEILGATDDTNAQPALVSPTKIKVIGCGGCGGNAVNNMIDAGIRGVQFIALNTDLQHLSISKAECTVQIGKKITNGLGAGMHPEVGEEAAKEDEEEIRNLLQGSDMVFITAGMGGGTGTGSAPIVARIARECGALTVAVVTTPFKFEGISRMSVAEDGIKKLREEVDSLIVIPNQRVFEGEGKKPAVLQGFKIIDDILRQGVQGISEIITKIGVVNRDFHDVQTVMKDQGDAILGIGVAEGENRAIDAATAAINNKLLVDTHIDGAKNVLIKISGNETINFDECGEIVNVITASADKGVKVLWGLYIEPELGDKISVTVIATGFNAASSAIPDELVDSLPPVSDTPKSADVFSQGDFEDLMNPSKILSQSDVAKKASITEDEVSFLVGKDVKSPAPAAAAASGNRGNLTAAMNAAANRVPSMPVPPPDFKSTGDLKEPTCWRNVDTRNKTIDCRRK